MWPDSCSDCILAGVVEGEEVSELRTLTRPSGMVGGSVLTEWERLEGQRGDGDRGAEVKSLEMLAEPQEPYI